MVFEVNHQLYELTMSACSPAEELVWRARLKSHTCKDDTSATAHLAHETLLLHIKSMGTVFGRPGKSSRCSRWAT